MSTLKTHNLQSSDSGSVNIALTANAGMIITGISTFNDRIDIGSLGVTTNFTVAGISTFSGNVILNSGNLQLGSTSGQDSIIHTPNAAGILYRADENGHRFQTYVGGWQDRLSIIDDGKVGVGRATSLNCIFTAQDSTGSISSSKTVTAEFRREDGTRNPRIQILHNQDGSIIHHTYSTGASNLMFDVGGTEKLRITTDGKIFVGSDHTNFSDTGTFFNLKNDTYGGRIGFSNNTASAGATLMEQFAYWGTNKVAGFIAAGGTDTTNKDDGELAFYTRQSGSAVVEALRIKDDGEIRIRGVKSGNSVPNVVVTFDILNSNGDSKKAEIKATKTGDITSELIFSTTVSHTFAERMRIDSSGHFRPAVNNTYDLGTSSNRWRNVYTTDLQLSNKGKTNDVDNTWGDYTIQEGESDLFLINNRSGKKYVFLLKEVS